MTKPPIALEDRGEEDGRLFSPSAGRNKAHIAAVLSEVLPSNASVLEAGSGTGEHGVEVLTARPDLSWQFSDPDAKSRDSQSAWIKHLGLDQNTPLPLDLTDPHSLSQLALSYDAIFSANMIHIAPIEALHGLAQLAEARVANGGQVWLYGPFLFGEDSATSNIQFDASLKRRNPAWGVREIGFVKHIFAKHGFNACTLRNMPSNNFFLGFSRD
jgi:hypothetical protein